MNSGEILPASTVVIAMGAWSGQAQRWLGKSVPAFSGQKAHSIVVRTTEPVTAHCLFLNHRNKSGAVVDLAGAYGCEGPSFCTTELSWGCHLCNQGGCSVLWIQSTAWEQPHMGMHKPQ